MNKISKATHWGFFKLFFSLETRNTGIVQNLSQFMF